MPSRLSVFASMRTGAAMLVSTEHCADSSIRPAASGIPSTSCTAASLAEHTCRTMWMELKGCVLLVCVVHTTLQHLCGLGEQ